jgi:polyribonucleotide nucleotidyltransferase
LPAGAAESAAAGALSSLSGLSLSHSADRRISNPDEVTFSIPKQSVGVVIGKGGQALKDLQAEFGVRVYVEREEVCFLIFRPSNCFH